MASAVGISLEKVHSILTEDLNMRKLSALWVPRLLTVDKKHTRQNMSHANLNLFETAPVRFLLRFVTMDETWVHHFTPESKQQLNNGSFLAHPAKEGKLCFDSWKVYGLIFFF